MEAPYMDLTPLLAYHKDAEALQQLENFNVLESVPQVHHSMMDSSQMDACIDMLTKSLSIVQGPPGTGKTFTSVNALKTMLANLGPGEPPIIIAAQTNHAIDQLLDLIGKFEPEFLRLGGRSGKQNEAITSRTLHELRKKRDKPRYRNIRIAWSALTSLTEDVKECLAPLLDNNLLADEILLQKGIITQSQYESLHEDDWVTAYDPTLPEGPLSTCKCIIKLYYL